MLSFKTLNETVPHGIESNFYYQSRQPFILGWCLFVIVSSILAVGFRFWARHLTGQKLWVDDWLALATVPFCMVNSALTIWQMSYGFGRHEVVVLNSDPKFLLGINKVIFIALFLYQAGLAFFKLSLLALYWRLFSVHTWVRYYVIIVATLIIMWTITMELLNVFRCHPISEGWINPLSSQCLLSFQTDYYFVQTIPTIILDVAILCIPIPIIWTIQLTPQNRVGITIVFLATCIVTVISALRLHLSLTTPKVDTTYTRIRVRMWSLTELLVGLFSACLLTYGPFIRLLNTKIRELCGRKASSRIPGESPNDSLHLVDSEKLGASPKDFTKKFRAWHK